MTNEEYFKWLSVTPGALAIQEAYLADQELKAKKAAGGKITTNDLTSWWTSVYGMWQQNPAEFQKWAQTDVNMATRWYALAQNDGQNLTLNGKPYSAKQLQADNMALLQSAGVDLKNDGKLYTTNFNTVSDVNNNWGAGDFWKIGTYNSADGGVVDTVKNIAESPTAIAGIAMMVALPWVAPQLGAAIASATGMSAAAANTAAASILSAGSQAVRGGDLSQIVTAGISAALPGLAEMHMPAILNSISPEVSTAYQSLVAQAPATVEEGQRVWDNLPSIRDIRGVIDPNIPQGDQPTGVKYDMPILNPVVAVPPPVGPVGGTTSTSGSTSSPPIGGTTGSVQDGSQGSTGGLVLGNEGVFNGANIPTVTVPPVTSGGVPTDTTGTGVQDTKQEQYTWNGTDLINVKTGEKAPRPPSGTWRVDTMNKGVIYNGKGEPVGGDPNSGLDLGYLIWASQAQQDAIKNGGQLVLGPNGVPTGTTGTNTGTTGTNTGTTGTNTGTTGTNTGTTGTDTTNTGGEGGGNTTETGGNNTPANFDWTSLIPLLIPFIPQPDEDKRTAPTGVGLPQDMSTKYQKPTYAPVQQKSLFDLHAPGMQAPMVTPAANSNQPTYEQWYQEWLRGQNKNSTGVLPSGSLSLGGLL